MKNPVLFFISSIMLAFFSSCCPESCNEDCYEIISADNKGTVISAFGADSTQFKIFRDTTLQLSGTSYQDSIRLFLESGDRIETISYTGNRAPVLNSFSVRLLNQNVLNFNSVRTIPNTTRPDCSGTIIVSGSIRNQGAASGMHIVEDMNSSRTHTGTNNAFDIELLLTPDGSRCKSGFRVKLDQGIAADVEVSFIDVLDDTEVNMSLNDQLILLRKN